MENYCCNLTTPGRIRTLHAGLVQVYLSQTYLHKDLLTKLNTAKNIFIYQHVWQTRTNKYVQPVLNACASAYVPPQLENKICFYGFYRHSCAWMCRQNMKTSDT